METIGTPFHIVRPLAEVAGSRRHLHRGPTHASSTRPGTPTLLGPDVLGEGSRGGFESAAAVHPGTLFERDVVASFWRPSNHFQKRRNGVRTKKPIGPQSKRVHTTERLILSEQAFKALGRSVLDFGTSEASSEGRCTSNTDQNYWLGRVDDPSTYRVMFSASNSQRDSWRDHNGLNQTMDVASASTQESGLRSGTQ